MRIKRGAVSAGKASALLLVLPLWVISAEPRFSGVVESNAKAAAGNGREFLWEMEQFANIRRMAEDGENTVFLVALNASAVSANDRELGTGAEVERLYVSIRSGMNDIDAGYMRIPFGYGQAFRPTDILNPPDPLFPEARPRGVLGALWAAYPSDSLKIQLFGADRNDPFKPYPGYSTPVGGASGEIHTPELSFQFLFALQGQKENSADPPVAGYYGFSLKFDAVAGFTVEALLSRTDRDAGFNEQLQFAAGVDYSLLRGKLYLLAQYYFNGKGYLDADDKLSDLYGTAEWEKLSPGERVPVPGFADYYRKHYLFTSAAYAASDYTRITLDLLAALEDGSFLPAVTAEHEPVQGMTLSLTARVPLDMHTLGGSRKGELGPEHAGYEGMLRGSVKVRF